MLCKRKVVKPSPENTDFGSFDSANAVENCFVQYMPRPAKPATPATLIALGIVRWMIVILCLDNHCFIKMETKKAKMDEKHSGRTLGLHGLNRPRNL